MFFLDNLQDNRRRYGYSSLKLMPGRARERSPSVLALEELLAGMREATGMATPPLEPRAGGRLRIREFITGVGRQT